MSDERRGLSRRQLLGAGAAAGVAAAVGCAGRASPETTPSASAGQVAAGAPGDTADLVLVNGRIHTMDRGTVAKTVSMRNGRFLTVDDGAPARGARVIDLEGRTVVPGIIDNHNHIVLMGNRPGYHTPLENAASIRDVQETFAARAKAIPRGAWITTIGGFHRNQLVPPGQMPRLPTLAELDEAVPNTLSTSRSRSPVPLRPIRSGRSSSRARFPRYPSPQTARSRTGRKARAARLWRCGERS